MDYSVLIKPMVGALIGYSTNWLAIKMLFRPYEEKRIGGIKIPFTPGVIPRERDRIARSLGSAVGNKLLTEEVIGNELLNDQVIAHIKNYVIDELMKNDVSMNDLLHIILKDEASKVHNSVGKTIVNELGMTLNTPTTKALVRQRLFGLIADTIPYKQIIGDMVKPELTDGLLDVLQGNIENVNGYMLELVRSEGVQARLSQAIEVLVMEKVGALGAMFLDGPSMAVSISDYIEQVLQEEEVQKGIVDAAGNGIQRICQRELSETVNIGLYNELVNGLTELVLTTIYQNLTEDVLTEMIYPLIQKMFDKKIHLENHDKELIETQVEELYRKFIEKNIGTFLETFEVSKIVESEINQFSVKEIEGLIFDIVDKELNAITWIGGILGFVIGVVYIFI